MKKRPLISIVIPTHNRRISIDRLLQSISKNTYKNIEIFVIDDASVDDTYIYIKEKYKKENFTILKNASSHYVSYCRNRGAKLARGEYIFFVDDDNVLPSNLLQELLNAFELDNKIGEVGPIIYSFEDKKQLLWMKTERNMLTTKTYFPRDLKLFNKHQELVTDDIPNAFIVKSEIVKKQEIYFNEKLFPMHYEESDYAYRIRKLGYKVVVASKAIIYHDYRKEKGGAFQHSMEDSQRTYLNARNRLVFHSIYSTLFQRWMIILFWNWLFALYYIFIIMFFSGDIKITVRQKMQLIFTYLRGCKDGLAIAIPRLFVYVD
jgi:GT2 family glycosyltransferase